MSLQRVEMQLASLERLVPHLTQHGCDLSAQDAARVLMRTFDAARLSGEDKALGRAYAELRGKLQEIAEGRSGYLPISKVAVFTRCYREHLLREEPEIQPFSLSAARAAHHRLDS